MDSRKANSRQMKGTYEGGKDNLGDGDEDALQRCGNEGMRRFAA